MRLAGYIEGVKNGVQKCNGTQPLVSGILVSAASLLLGLYSVNKFNNYSSKAKRKMVNISLPRRGRGKYQPLLFDACVFFSLAASPPRDLQITAFK